MPPWAPNRQHTHCTSVVSLLHVSIHPACPSADSRFTSCEMICLVSQTQVLHSDLRSSDFYPVFRATSEQAPQRDKHFGQQRKQALVTRHQQPRSCVSTGRKLRDGWAASASAGSTTRQSAPGESSPARQAEARAKLSWPASLPYSHRHLRCHCQHH